MCGYGGIGRRAGFRCQSGQLGAGSTPVIRTILVVLNSCTPLKARRYGFFWRLRGKKFKVKTMAVFSWFLRMKRI